MMYITYNLTSITGISKPIKHDNLRMLILLYFVATLNFIVKLMYSVLGV